MDNRTDSNILCLGWCDADDVINYGQILQGCSMMYLLRHFVYGKITYISFFPRTKKRQLLYWLKHFSITSGHLIPYLKTRKVLNSFIHDYRIHFIKASDDKTIEKMTQNVDCYICGSDQIWHPQNYDKYFFLGFGDKNIKRVSYAPSIPKTRIESQYKRQITLMRSYLNNFEAISIREKMSVLFVRELSQKNVSTVLDPTYLVPKTVWDSFLEKKRVKDKYILAYIPNGMDCRMSELIEELREKIHISAVYSIVTRGNRHMIEGNEIGFVSLGQFLYLIKNATCVITSSFHAVVFCTIFHKEFWCYNCTDPVRGEDIRLVSLLRDLGIEQRLIIPEEKIDYKKIDFQAVDQRIESLKINSITFLRNALNSDKK